MLEMYYDGTGHYYRNSQGNKWIRMEDDKDEIDNPLTNSPELKELQALWAEKYDLLFSQNRILDMLEDAEEISIKTTVNVSNYMPHNQANYISDDSTDCTCF